ncbi:hypothetical protein [Klebsiella sp. PL-2018]|uniref:hypothetical protein n=1 Tax=Klebsiella sp. PL-2018 TaxID=2851540 RepID=UPI001E2C3F1A|nr:hypothetical protein [Klebsiella sp. PL-2018]
MAIKKGIRFIQFSTGSALRCFTAHLSSTTGREGVRFHVGCLLLATSGEVVSWLFPNNKDSVNLDIPNNKRAFTVITGLSAVMTAIKESASLVKVINDAKTDAEVKTATIDLQGKLITLQAECFSLGDVIRLRDEEMALLKAKIAEYEDFKSESEGYELHQTESGSLVYSKQIAVNGSQVSVNACPSCYQKKRISLLQPGVDKSVKGYSFVHFCPSCNAEFKMNKMPKSKPTVRRIAGSNPWRG